MVSPATENDGKMTACIPVTVSFRERMPVLAQGHKITKMSRAQRRSVGRDKGQGSEEGRVDFAVGDH